MRAKQPESLMDVFWKGVEHSVWILIFFGSLAFFFSNWITWTLFLTFVVLCFSGLRQTYQAAQAQIAEVERQRSAEETRIREAKRLAEELQRAARKAEAERKAMQEAEQRARAARYAKAQAESQAADEAAQAARERARQARSEAEAAKRATANHAQADNAPRGDSRWSSPDPYVILGIPHTADCAAIRTAYGKLSRQYHPDRVASLGPEFIEMAEARMKAINSAYSAVRS